MKRKSLFTLLGLGLLSLTGIVFGATRSTGFAVAKAEPEDAEPAPEAEVFECQVIIAEAKPGEVTVDKVEGHVGEIVTINAKHDVLYLLESVSVNGTNLVESEEIAGQFTFALVEGENKIEAVFAIDQELLGEMSIIMDQALNKDWTNLFSVENVIRIVTFLLNGGILIAIVRYFIKDKAVAAKVEKAVTETVKKYVPDTTKEIVVAIIKETIAPIFAELKLENEEMRNALTVFSRCFALAQENTPEAKIAIVQELSSLKLSDQESISRVKSTIEQFIAEQTAKMAEILAKMQNIEDTNRQIVEQANPEVEVRVDLPEPNEDKEATPYE